MSTASPPLTSKQIDVLNWVKHGCPDGVYEGYGHRLSARALASRGLVKVVGHGAAWAATITDAGRDWQSGRARPGRRTSRTPKATAPAVDARPAMPHQLGKMDQANELIHRVVEAGGHLPVPEGSEAFRLHQELVRLSLESRDRPHGKKLEIANAGTAWFGGLQEIVFTDHFDDLVDPQPVPVFDKVAKYSLVVRAYLNDKDWQYVSSAHLSRAARILEAMVREAPNRGLTVLPPRPPVDRQRFRPTAESKQHVALAVGDSTYYVQIREISKLGGASMTPPYSADRNRHAAWMYERRTTFVPTGRLELVVRGPFCGYDGSCYRDVKTITVEDKLPRLFQSLEVYRLQAEAAAEEGRLRDEERRRRWEAAMAEARVRYDHNARWEHFKRTSEEWQEVGKRREFLAAARAAATTYDGQDRAAILAQLDMAETQLDELDPLRRPQLLAPVVKEPGNDDLKPFLKGWSPSAPNGF